MTKREAENAELALLGVVQVFPGWYILRQCVVLDQPPWADAGHLHVEGEDGAATTETWYLYSEGTDSGGGSGGLERRVRYQAPGSPGRLTDSLKLEQVPSNLGAPSGIRYKKIVARCDAPVDGGP